MPEAFKPPNSRNRDAAALRPNTPSAWVRSRSCRANGRACLIDFGSMRIARREARRRMPSATASAIATVARSRPPMRAQTAVRADFASMMCLRATVGGMAFDRKARASRSHGPGSGHRRIYSRSRPCPPSATGGAGPPTKPIHAFGFIEGRPYRFSLPPAGRELPRGGDP